MNKAPKFDRINDIFLGPLERPALKWLAAHMPPWMNPDILTGIGFLGAVIIFTGYALTSLNRGFLWLASFGFLVNWFGDSLDGTLARYRKIERPRFGFYIDHVVDCAASVLLLLGMGLSPYVNFTIASLTLISYLMVSILVYLLTIAKGVFRISSGKIGPTEIRAILIIANTITFFYSKPLFSSASGGLTIFDILMSILGVGLLVLFIVNALMEAKIINEQEQMELRAKKAKVEEMERTFTP